MECYDVLVRNEETGESVTMPIESSCCQEAQTEALIRLFRERGWRKASAPPPVARAPVEM